MLHTGGRAMWSTNSGSGTGSGIGSSRQSVTEFVTLFAASGCQRLLLLKAGHLGDVFKFEELWLGTQSLSLPCSEERDSLNCAVHLGVERMDSPSSPLPPEDCVVSAITTCSAMFDRRERSSTKSRSLFNIDVDHTSETKNPGECSLVDHVNADEVAENKDHLPSISVDAWSLLQDFESLYQITSDPSTPATQLPSDHLHPLTLQDQQAHYQQQLLQPIAMEGNLPADYLSCLEEEVPLFADLDELDAMLCDAEAEDAANFTPNITTTTLDMAAVTALFTLGDYPDSLQPDVPLTQPPHTSDLLANLITGTILVDPSLEGLLSNTTLDFNSVFGETVVTANCNTSQTELSDEVRSVDSCSPASTVQEVPEIILTNIASSSCSDSNLESLTRSVRSSVKRRLSSSTSSCSEMDKSVVGRLSVDDDSEPPVTVKRPRKSSAKVVEDKFVEMRKKNNEASRRSRYARKQKYTKMEQEMHQLEKRNKLLTGEADRLEKMVNTLKAAMFKCIQKV